jgi:hypothetical protein
MSDLNEMQFELLASVNAVDGQVFGIGANVSIDDKGFLPGEDDWDDQDERNPSRGGTAFGRDTLNGPTWGFNLHVDETDVISARKTLAAFKTAWRALHIRETPGAVIPLRYRLGDEVRRVYGRPRRFAAPPDNLILSGYIPITADFACADAFTYDDLEQSITLSLGVVGSSEGGMTFPLTFPIATLPVGTTQQQAVVGGDAPTYPIVRFNGPVTNPTLVNSEWTLSLDMTIPAGSYVEVDLRPWGLTAMMNGNTSVAGALGRRQYLSNMKLNPGRYDFTYRGSSSSSSSTCEVRWSNAWNSI